MDDRRLKLSAAFALAVLPVLLFDKRILPEDMPHDLRQALLYGLGVIFGLTLAAALWATRRLHGVRPTPRRALLALTLIGLAWPAAFYLGGFGVVSAMVGSHAWLALYYAAPPLGALAVAAAAWLVTGRLDRPVAAVMAAAGGAWFVSGPFGLSDSGLGLLLWQLPVALLVAAWVWRGEPAPADAPAPHPA